jgi:hypothetical protein
MEGEVWVYSNLSSAMESIFSRNDDFTPNCFRLTYKQVEDAELVTALSPKGDSF